MKRSVITISDDDKLLLEEQDRTVIPDILPAEILQKIYTHQLDLQTVYIDALHYHSVNKRYFKDWCNETYQFQLMQKMIERNKKYYAIKRHASFASSVLRLKFIERSLLIAYDIIQNLPDLEWLSRATEHNTAFSTHVLIGQYFTPSDTKNKFKPIKQSELAHLLMIKQFIIVRYGWKITACYNESIIWRNGCDPVPHTESKIAFLL